MKLPDHEGNKHTNKQTNKSLIHFEMLTFFIIRFGVWFWRTAASLSIPKSFLPFIVLLKAIAVILIAPCKTYNKILIASWKTDTKRNIGNIDEKNPHSERIIYLFGQENDNELECQFVWMHVDAWWYEREGVEREKFR